MVKRAPTFPLFRQDLQKVMGGGASRLFPFAEWLSPDTTHWEDHFLGPTIDSNRYTLANGGGSGAVSPAIQAGVNNGVARLTTGTNNDNTASSELAGGLNFRGDHGAVFLTCFSNSSWDNTKVEAGFTDALNDAGAVAIKANPTFNADDCAVWILDTTDTGAGFEGVATNNKDTNPMATVEAAITPVAGTFEWFMVELIETDAANNQCAVAFRRFSADGLLTFEQIGGGAGDGVDQGPNGNVLLTPWLYHEARNATSKDLDVRYIGYWQRGTTSA